MQFARTVKLVLVPTKEMSADLFTKALDEETFTRHRDDVMNAKAATTCAHPACARDCAWPPRGFVCKVCKKNPCICEDTDVDE